MNHPMRIPHLRAPVRYSEEIPLLGSLETVADFLSKDAAIEPKLSVMHA
jgi:hypothetical protein